MNPNSRIREGIEALREAPVRGKEEAMQAIRNHHVTRTPWKLVGVAASLGAVGVIASVALWPRPTLAQEVQKMQQADAGAQSVIERNWNRGPSGQMELYNEVVRLNGRYKMKSKEAATQYFDGKRIINDHGTYATIEDRPAKMWKSRASSLHEMLHLDSIKHWTVDYGAKTAIGPADRYVVSWEAAGRSGQIELLADSKTHRPIRQTGIEGNSVGFKYEWDYRPIRESDVSFQPMPGYPVYDLDSQRADFLRLLGDAKGTAENPEIVAAYVDETGLGVVFTCGDDGYDPENPISPVVAGKTGEAGGFTWGQFESGRQHAALYRGKMITAHGVKLVGKIPDAGPVSVSVQTPRGERTLRVEQMPIRRAASLPFLFAPMNIPFFMDSDEEGQATRASG